ncbi:MAG: tetratricopeptide repeat protein [Atribacterota bacterium]
MDTLSLQTVSEEIVLAVWEMPEFGTIMQMTAPFSPGSSGSPVVNMLQVKKGKYEEAIRAFERAVRIKPDYAGAYYDLGLVYLILGGKGSVFEEYKILKNLGDGLQVRCEIERRTTKISQVNRQRPHRERISIDKERVRTSIPEPLASVSKKARTPIDDPFAHKGRKEKRSS